MKGGGGPKTPQSGTRRGREPEDPASQIKCDKADEIQRHRAKKCDEADKIQRHKRNPPPGAVGRSGHDPAPQDEPGRGEAQGGEGKNAIAEKCIYPARLFGPPGVSCQHIGG